MSANRFQQPKEAGSILLISILVLSVISSVAFVLSSLLLREILLARLFDDSLQAYYAAESGIERSLDVVGEHRELSTSLNATMTAVENFAPIGTPVQLTNSGADYVIDDAETYDGPTALTGLYIPMDGRTAFEFYDPDNPFTLLYAESLQIYWNHPTCGTSSRIEVTYDEFDSATFGTTDDSVVKDVFTCGSEVPLAGWDCQVTSNRPAKNHNYIVRLRALDCDIFGAELAMWVSDNGQGAGCPSKCNYRREIPSRVRILSRGSDGQTQRQIVAETKWLPSAAGLADFVLFSVEPVEK